MRKEEYINAYASEIFWRTQKKPAVCAVHTICQALYLRGGFRSLPSN